jgi:hypothetical protein
MPCGSLGFPLRYQRKLACQAVALTFGLIYNSPQHFYSLHQLVEALSGFSQASIGKCHSIQERSYIPQDIVPFLSSFQSRFSQEAQQPL